MTRSLGSRHNVACRDPSFEMAAAIFGLEPGSLKRLGADAGGSALAPFKKLRIPGAFWGCDRIIITVPVTNPYAMRIIHRALFQFTIKGCYGMITSSTVKVNGIYIGKGTVIKTATN